MLRKTLVTHTGLGLLLLAMACGDDAKRDDEDPTGSVNPDSGPVVSRQDGGGSGNGGKMDAGLGLDGAVVDDDTDPVVTLPDGAVVGGDNGDAATTTPSTPDASIDGGTGTGTGADASADTGTTTPPVTTPVTDAGTNPPVTTPDAGDCSINDPVFGCGTAVTPNWIRFDSGYEVDRTYKRVWSPTVEVISPELLGVYCTTLTVGDVTHVFDIPEIEEVRTLAAGCPATITDGACAIKQNEWLPSNSGTCSCSGATTGPHVSGGFCRPEVSSCDILVTRTYCGSTTECTPYQRWLYDVRNGSVVLETPELNQLAKGRCVSDWLTVP